MGASHIVHVINVYDKIDDWNVIYIDGEKKLAGNNIKISQVLGLLPTDGCTLTYENIELITLPEEEDLHNKYFYAYPYHVADLMQDLMRYCFQGIGRDITSNTLHFTIKKDE